MFFGCLNVGINVDADNVRVAYSRVGLPETAEVVKIGQ